MQPRRLLRYDPRAIAWKHCLAAAGKMVGRTAAAAAAQSSPRGAARRSHCPLHVILKIHPPAAVHMASPTPPASRVATQHSCAQCCCHNVRRRSSPQLERLAMPHSAAVASWSVTLPAGAGSGPYTSLTVFRREQLKQGIVISSSQGVQGADQSGASLELLNLRGATGAAGKGSAAAAACLRDAVLAAHSRVQALQGMPPRRHPCCGCTQQIPGSTHLVQRVVVGAHAGVVDLRACEMMRAG